jgi:hypothetical protein
MVGQRQQQIIDVLAAGSFSFEALVRRISPDRAEDRRLITASLRRLAGAGLVRVEGRVRGRHDMTGTMIALPLPPRVTGTEGDFVVGSRPRRCGGRHGRYSRTASPVNGEWRGLIEALSIGPIDGTGLAETWRGVIGRPLRRDAFSLRPISSSRRQRSGTNRMLPPSQKPKINHHIA